MLRTAPAVNEKCDLVAGGAHQTELSVALRRLCEKLLQVNVVCSSSAIASKPA
jgi:hypothetical protein